MGSRVLLGSRPIEDREQLKASNTLRPSQAVLDLASAVRFEFIGTFMLCRSLCKFWAQADQVEGRMASHVYSQTYSYRSVAQAAVVRTLIQRMRFMPYLARFATSQILPDHTILMGIRSTCIRASQQIYQYCLKDYLSSSQNHPHKHASPAIPADENS